MVEETVTNEHGVDFFGLKARGGCSFEKKLSLRIRNGICCLIPMHDTLLSTNAYELAIVILICLQSGYKVINSFKWFQGGSSCAKA